MSEPTTVRGRDMVARYALSQPDPADLSRFTYDIARIEAEAREQALQEAAGRIERLRDTRDPRERYVTRDENFRLVLTALEEVPAAPAEEAK